MNLTPEQRDAFLAVLEANPELGDVRALRAAGIPGSAPELRQMMADDAGLREDAWDARGWDVTPALSALQTVAIDTGHRAWNQANDRWIQLRGYTQKSRLELTGADGGPLAIEDRSASLSDVADVLTTVGALAPPHSGGTPDAEVPAAGEILAAPQHG